jgi:hypothetical protein
VHRHVAVQPPQRGQDGLHLPHLQAEGRQAVTRPSQIRRILAAHRDVGDELRNGDVSTLTRAFAVLCAAQRNASFEENNLAAESRLSELRARR